MAGQNSSIVVCGKKFDAGCRVVLWNEEEGLSFYPGGPYSKGKYKPRNLSLNDLRKHISCFVIHHSVTYTAHATFRGLIGRGLSVNFLIDDDINEDGCATIYQCLDVKEIGYSHKPLNEEGAGVEICYHPEFWENSKLYSESNVKKWGVQPHDIAKDRIHSHNFTVFAPTEAQIKACIRLLYAYSKAFPDLSTKFPRNEKGEFVSTVSPSQSGFLHHFNITKNKIDAMGFPTDLVEQEVNALLDTTHEETHLTKKLFDWILKRK